MNCYNDKKRGNAYMKNFAVRKPIVFELILIIVSFILTVIASLPFQILYFPYNIMKDSRTFDKMPRNEIRPKAKILKKHAGFFFIFGKTRLLTLSFVCHWNAYKKEHQGIQSSTGQQPPLTS